ncbi:putative gustatory receptor 28b [Neocloeon triangulifer]|uniref:putative gustatory receptor 28b n=1 Tax=Neocloeon triangulifer TaxID=2078957 RepID=UPI00286F0900|nr:putative gustatory receptor 28b [Neocloeon triangulifer]
MEQVFVKRLSCVLGITSRPTLRSRLYSLSIFCVITSSCLHLLYKSGLEPLLNPNTDVSLSIAYMFDLIARIARVISYIIMHILTYKHADRFEKIYHQLKVVNRRVCGTPTSLHSNDAFRFAVIFALIRLFATLTPVFSRSNTELLSNLMNIPFHLKFIFNFFMELQLFTFCSMLEMSFNAIRARLNRLRKHAPNNSLTQCGKVIVDKWGLPKQRSHMIFENVWIITYAESVRSLRRSHAELCDLANRINALFGVRLLVDITAQLLALLLRLKIVIIWTFTAIKSMRAHDSDDVLQDATEMERAISALVLCPIHIGTVYAVVFYCTRTVKKNELVLSEIYRLLNHSLDTKDSDELKTFALQLSHRKVQFTAAGVMPLDFSLLYSFIGVVTTYLVILTQFGASLSKYTIDCGGDLTKPMESTSNVPEAGE